MQTELTHRPSYTHLIAELAPGESIMAEPGAMVTHSPTISIETSSSRDGLLSSVKSMLGGESMFVNEFIAESEPGTVTLSPPIAGDIHHHELEGGTLYTVDGAYLASNPELDIEVEFGGLRSMLAGASITPLALTGTGNVFIEAFGGIETIDLDHGETYIVDNDHVVAWEDSIEFDARRVEGLKSTLLSGEGIVMEFTGPGTVWYQTRSLDAFTDAIVEAIPSTESGNDSTDIDF